MLRKYLLAACTAVCVLVAPLSASAGEKPLPTDTLQGLVTQLVDLTTETNAEETRWKEEKSHLDTTKALLQKENKKLDEEIAATKTEADVAESRRERLAREIHNSSTILERVDGSVRQTAEKLLESYRALPGPLRTTLAGGAARVRNALSANKESLNAADRFRLVAAFASDVNRTLSSIHAVKQMLKPGDETEREMDVLYVGGAVGYYVSPDRSQAGVVKREGAEWQCVPRNDLARTISRAFKIFRKEKSAALVKLPLPQEKKQ
ncbi:DUF3450 family protein [Planctomycetota bacterium]